MKRVKLTVAYDGTNYCGWQVQPNGITIQEVLNQCLSEFTGEKIETIGASRTDAGVHALGNVAVFDTEMRMPGDKFSLFKSKTSGRYPYSEVGGSRCKFSSSLYKKSKNL